MKTLFVLLIFMFFSEVHAQSCTDIRYTDEFMREGHFVGQSRYVYNDSSAFFYFYQTHNNPLRKSTVFSKKLIHHAKFTEKYTGITYDEVDYPANNKWLIKDTIKNEVWQPTGISKMILNISCTGYLKISEGGDSTLAYVSPALGDGKGFHYYAGLPGVALEVYDQATGYHIVAHAIQRMDCSFYLPNDVQQITKKDIKMAQIKNK